MKRGDRVDWVELLSWMRTVRKPLGPTKHVDNELVPALRACQQVLSNPVHQERVFSAWHDCDDNAAFTAMMEADDEDSVANITDEEIDALISQTAGSPSDEQSNEATAVVQKNNTNGGSPRELWPANRQKLVDATCTILKSYSDSNVPDPIIHKAMELVNLLKKHGIVNRQAQIQNYFHVKPSEHKQ